MSLRRFTFIADNDELSVQVVERLEPSYGLYTWPSSVVLAQYLWCNRTSLHTKNVLELGAGTGIPGIMAILTGKTQSVTLTDASHQPKCLHNLASSCASNGILTAKTEIEGFCCEQASYCGANVTIAGLTWGEVPPIFADHIAQGIPYPDIILGSDCLFEETVFDNVLFTVHYLLSRTTTGHAKFLCTYQVRSSKISLDYYMQQWGLKYREIALHEFCPDQYDIASSGMPGNHKIKLLEVTLNDI